MQIGYKCKGRIIYNVSMIKKINIDLKNHDNFLKVTEAALHRKFTYLKIFGIFFYLSFLQQSNVYFFNLRQAYYKPIPKLFLIFGTFPL